MNREELKPIELECNMGTDVNGVVHREPWKAYDIDEVDMLLDQYDNEIKTLKESIANGDVSRITWIDECLEKDAEIASLKAENEHLKEKLETVNDLLKASRDMMDGATAASSHVSAMRERRLQRALWRSRANNARNLVVVFENYDYLDFYKLNIKQESARTWMTCKLRTPAEWVNIWKDVQAKCLKKAEEYR